MSPEAIEAFRGRWATKTRDERKTRWTDEQTLSNAKLLLEGRITDAALTSFGTRAALRRWLAKAELVFEYREGFFRWHNAIWNKINLRNDRQSYQDGLFRVELPTFDEVPVRESLLNAVAHRDYRLGGSVFVRQYSQRLEVVSPGGLPTGITPANILDQQNPRNRRLAEALPNFAGTSAHEVRLTLHGTVASPAFVRFIERLGEKKLKSFSTYDFLALDYLRREQSMPDHLKASPPGLIAAGAVESIGRGRGTRSILARGLYAALGGEGVYSRKKGLNRGTNKALLLNHIQDNAASGAQMEEFRQVLPALARSQIQVLLRELRKEGAIHRGGLTKAARWYAGARRESLQP